MYFNEDIPVVGYAIGLYSQYIFLPYRMYVNVSPLLTNKLPLLEIAQVGANYQATNRIPYSERSILKLDAWTSVYV